MRHRTIRSIQMFFTSFSLDGCDPQSLHYRTLCIMFCLLRRLYFYNERLYQLIHMNKNLLKYLRSFIALPQFLSQNIVSSTDLRRAVILNCKKEKITTSIPHVSFSKLNLCNVKYHVNFKLILGQNTIWIFLKRELFSLYLM